jgi:GTP-binding protein EngB required for normal cell division
LIDILIDKQTPINLVMTKSDKVASKFIKEKTLETIEQLKAKGLLQLCSPIINMVSSYTGYGMLELRCALVQSYDQPSLRVEGEDVF